MFENAIVKSQKDQKEPQTNSDIEKVRDEKLTFGNFNIWGKNGT